ncbi:MFS transporter, partial [Pseudonocardia nigra]|uniref:MFS transporter n=1 Tax=Pseudonocardia nigra TaxID=1921578 RepID=UPI001C5DAD9A
QQIGILAPILLVVFRLLQGLSAAGETIGSNSFVAEHSPQPKRGRFVATVYTWSNLPPVLAALLVLALTHSMSTATYESWGWRVPFLLGAPLALVGLYIRTRVHETPAFTALRETKRVESSPIRTVLREHPRAMATCFSIAAVASLGYYSLTGYFFTYMTVTVGLSDSAALVSNSIALTITFVTVPLAGALSDRIGRRRALQIAAIMNAGFAVPAYLLAAQGSLLPQPSARASWRSASACSSGRPGPRSSSCSPRALATRAPRSATTWPSPSSAAPLRCCRST